LIGITVFAFLFIQLLPGDPIQTMLGGKATQEVIEAAHQKFGLDQPLPVQYLLFLRNAIQGDLGTSITQRTLVSGLIAERIVPSIFLLLYAMIIAMFLALPLSIVAARRSDRLVDHTIRISGMITISMPAFWLGLLLILLFGLTLDLFPISGWGDDFLGHVHSLFLPALVIGLATAPVLIQSLRASLLDTMQMDFIEAARAKGLSATRIMVRHVLRNALIPMVTVLAVNVGWLIGGSVVVENVFSIPGIGRLLVQAVLTRDYPTIQALTLVFGILVLIVNLITDLTYAIVDPRVAY
jgi:ABC-type dipeptide/oligopeptide/nickel transport system permease component